MAWNNRMGSLYGGGFIYGFRQRKLALNTEKLNQTLTTVTE